MEFVDQAVLMDFDRLEAISCPLSFRGDRANPAFHDPDMAYKFLVVWKKKEGPVFVIGPVNGHLGLYNAYTGLRLPLEEARAAMDNSSWQFVKSVIQNSIIMGAGNVAKDGRITSWKSEGFSITTPHADRPDIEAVITGLFTSGALRLSKPQT